MKRPPLSLQARALAWLAQREQSRSELRRKLLRVARLQLAQTQADGTGTASEDEIAAQVEQLLDALQAKGLLCEERFVESRVRVRAPGMGTRRIQVELARHGLKLAPQPLQDLRESELQRAAQLWSRKFGAAAQDAKARARQMRFLASRGFSGEVIRRVVPAADQRSGDDAEAD